MLFHQIYCDVQVSTLTQCRLVYHQIPFENPTKLEFLHLCVLSKHILTVMQGLINKIFSRRQKCAVIQHSLLRHSLTQFHDCARKTKQQRNNEPSMSSTGLTAAPSDHWNKLIMGQLLPASGLIDSCFSYSTVQNGLASN